MEIRIGDLENISEDDHLMRDRIHRRSDCIQAIESSTNKSSLARILAYLVSQEAFRDDDSTMQVPLDSARLHAQWSCTGLWCYRLSSLTSPSWQMIMGRHLLESATHKILLRLARS